MEWIPEGTRLNKQVHFHFLLLLFSFFTFLNFFLLCNIKWQWWYPNVIHVPAVMWRMILWIAVPQSSFHYKIPWIFPEFSLFFKISLTNFKMPWFFPDLEKNSIFPDFSLTVGTQSRRHLLGLYIPYTKSMVPNFILAIITSIYIYE